MENNKKLIYGEVMSEILKLSEVVKITGLSKSTIYEYMKHGLFPKQIKIGIRRVGWTSSSISSWTDKKIVESEDQDESQ